MSADSRRILCVGLCCVDIISVNDGYPDEDTDQRSLDYYWQRGGNASNSSTVLALLGADVEFLGTMVKGQEYGFITSDFRQCGVNVENCRVHEEGRYRCPVSIVVINKRTGSRTIMAALNHLAELEQEDFDRIDLNNYKWIHFEGRPTVAAVRATLMRVTEHNARVSTENRVNTSIEMEKPTRTELMQLMEHVDYVFVSKEFAMEQGYSCKEAAVEALVDRCRDGGTVICAWGEDGAAAKTKSRDTVTSPISPPVQVIDTLAAGDTFNAATILALSQGKVGGFAIEFGCKVAGAKCGMKGKQGLAGMQSLLS